MCRVKRSSVHLAVRCPERPDQQFTIRRCTGCGMCYLCPRPSPAELARYYPEDYYAYAAPEVAPRSHGLKLALWRALGMLRDGRAGAPPRLDALCRRLATSVLGLRATWILPAPPGPRRFLDIGCGTGLRLRLATDLGWEAAGLDISSAPLQVARDRGHRGVVGRGESLPFATDSFDFVCLHHVLEHTDEPLMVLREVARVLAPGGLAQVVVPNADRWTARAYGACWRAWDAPRHLHHFTRATLQRAAEHAGLRVAWVRTLPDDWTVIESMRAAGVDRTVTRLDRWRWSWRARLGQGDALDAWLTAPGDACAP